MHTDCNRPHLDVLSPLEGTETVARLGAEPTTRLAGMSTPEHSRPPSQLRCSCGALGKLRCSRCKFSKCMLMLFCSSCSVVDPVVFCLKSMWGLF